MNLRKPRVFRTTFATFRATAQVGAGGSGWVYRAEDETSGGFAIKLLDPVKATPDRIKRFKNEVLFGINNRHANIIAIHDHGLFTDAKGRASPFYVMPYYAGSLRSLMHAGIAAGKVLTYFGQLLDGVEAAHLKKVTHRDLKPENVLYDGATDTLLIADFGIACFEQEDLYTAVETAPNARLANFQYAAPEQRCRGAEVDQRADIYALGLMLNEMFTQEVPQGTHFAEIASVAPEYGYLDEVVSAMLTRSPEGRPGSIEVVKQRLIARQNDFITRQRIDELQNTVVPTTSTDDDPLIADPPRLVGADWERGTLTLILSQPVNAKWIRTLQNMQAGFTFSFAHHPSQLQVSGDRAKIAAAEHEVQQVVDFSKGWLQVANDNYKADTRAEKAQIERQERQRLQAEMAELEQRQRVLKSVKI